TELQKVLSVLGKDDALVVTRLDRLGRSLRHLANIAHEIEEPGAHLKVLEQRVDTSSAVDPAFFGMLAVFAALETACAANASSKAAMAKRQAAHKGGKARLDRKRVKMLSKDGFGPAAVARGLGMGRRTRRPPPPRRNRTGLQSVKASDPARRGSARSMVSSMMRFEKDIVLPTAHPEKNSPQQRKVMPVLCINCHFSGRT